jgi:hypothetical protein
MMSISETMFTKDKRGKAKGKTTRKAVRNSSQVLDRINFIPSSSDRGPAE